MVYSSAVLMHDVCNWRHCWATLLGILYAYGRPLAVLFPRGNWWWSQFCAWYCRRVHVGRGGKSLLRLPECIQCREPRTLSSTHCQCTERPGRRSQSDVKSVLQWCTRRIWGIHHQTVWISESASYEYWSVWELQCKNCFRKIAGRAVTLTCYISHSAKHTKVAEFDLSGSQKLLNRFWENLAWLTTSGTPPHTTLVGVAQRGWSGHIMTCHISEFFFLFFLFFLQYIA